MGDLYNKDHDKDGQDTYSRIMQVLEGKQHITKVNDNMACLKTK